MTQNTSNSLRNAYVYDWLTILAIYIVYYLVDTIKPIERQFAIDDISISHPHKEDTIKMVILLVIIERKTKVLYIYLIK